MNFFDDFLIYFSYFIVPSFIIAIIGGLLIFKRKNSENASKKYKKLGLIFVIQLIVFFTLLYSLHVIFNRMLKNDFLTTINSSNIVFKINGENIDIDSSKHLINDLRKFVNVPPNHAGPTKEIKIDILTNKKLLNLSLYRSNQDSSLYWVHINNYKTSAMNNFGQIRTKLLNKY